VFDPELIRDVALALRTQERYIEKDWHIVRALGVIASITVDGVTPVFSGGTSLSTAWQLINRFSEDIDFKVILKGPIRVPSGRCGAPIEKVSLRACQTLGLSLRASHSLEI